MTGYSRTGAALLLIKLSEPSAGVHLAHCHSLRVNKTLTSTRLASFFTVVLSQRNAEFPRGAWALLTCTFSIFFSLSFTFVSDWDLVSRCFWTICFSMSSLCLEQ